MKMKLYRGQWVFVDTGRGGLLGWEMQAAGESGQANPMPPGEGTQGLEEGHLVTVGGGWIFWVG